MRATPRVVADFDEYPELRVLADAAIRRVVELMEIHDIVEIRRIHKTGVFDHPYVKDVVTPIGLRIPNTVSATRYAAGKALLDYLETIGIQGVSLELTKDDAAAIASLWNPPEKKEAQNKSVNDLEPVKVSDDKTNGKEEQQVQEKQPSEQEQSEKPGESNVEKQ